VRRFTQFASDPNRDREGAECSEWPKCTEAASCLDARFVNPCNRFWTRDALEDKRHDRERQGALNRGDLCILTLIALTHYRERLRIDCLHTVE